MKWGDTLCGVEVTPQSWIEGIVAAGQQQGRGWHLVSHINTAWPNRFVVSGDNICVFIDESAPIFPPRGWAGKTDADLCREIFGHAELAKIADDVTLRTFELDLKVSKPDALIYHPRLSVNISTWDRTLEETAALILALQNAQLLADRLRTQEHPND